MQFMTTGLKVLKINEQYVFNLVGQNWGCCIIPIRIAQFGTQIGRAHVRMCLSIKAGQLGNPGHGVGPPSKNTVQSRGPRRSSLYSLVYSYVPQIEICIIHNLEEACLTFCQGGAVMWRSCPNHRRRCIC